MSTTTKQSTEVLEVTVNRIRHSSSNFAIYDAQTAMGEWRPLIIKQFAGPVGVGQRWIVAGKEIKDPKWGKQFAASYATLARPCTLKELELFLTSGLVEGWGWRGYAALIENLRESELLSICANSPYMLEDVPGITNPMIASLLDMWTRGGNLAQVYADLAEWGVNGRTADALVKFYGPLTSTKLTDNPYSNLLDIPGYGWKTAEQIASWVGILPADTRRVRAGIELGVHNATWQEGHTWLTAHQAARAGSALLGMPYTQVVPEIDAAIENGHVVKRGEQLYPTPLDDAESAIVGEITARLIRPGLINVQRTEGMFVGTQLGWKQVEAVLKGLTEPLSLLTGGPGTGKTTCLKTLVESALALGLQVSCMAPTGKAAARLSEATGHPASTIHSKLHILPGDTADDSADEQLSGLVIVDEVSMLDTSLAAAMFGRIAMGAQIVLVGDPDQLPSVGPGAVLRDLLTADVIPHTHLDHVYRNEAGIAVNAKRLREGQDILSLADCTIYEAQTPEQGELILLQALDDLDRRGVSPDDILILTPTNDGVTGRIELNTLLQLRLNVQPAGQGITQYVSTTTDPDGTVRRREEEIRLGDKVMVTRNNRELGVFNGQVGKVVGLTVPRSIDVDIDGEVKSFAGEDKRSLTLAYAITGHKAQGSEAAHVIVPIFPSRVLSREWLYTVLTRAKKTATFIGDVGALQGCIAVQRAQERRTGLADRLIAASEGAPHWTEAV